MHLLYLLLPLFHLSPEATVKHMVTRSDGVVEVPDIEQLPIFDTGATHCLLPVALLSAENAEQAKKIYLRVASQATQKALLFNNIIYAKNVGRPLLSVGQLKNMLDLRFL